MNQCNHDWDLTYFPAICKTCRVSYPLGQAPANVCQDCQWINGHSKYCALNTVTERLSETLSKVGHKNKNEFGHECSCGAVNHPEWRHEFSCKLYEEWK